MPEIYQNWLNNSIWYLVRPNGTVVTTAPSVDSDDLYDKQTSEIKAELSRVLGGTWEAGNQETCEDGDEECGWHRVE